MIARADRLGRTEAAFVFGLWSWGAGACGSGLPDATGGAAGAGLSSSTGGAAGAGLSSSTGGAAGAPTYDADRYEPIEITLAAEGTYANPYVDVEIQALVTPPSAAGEPPYTIPGFWDGGSTWRVRWAPRHAGDYHVTVESTVPTDAGLHGLTFDYQISNEYSTLWAPHGFVSIDADAPYYLRRDDGSHLLWVGDTNWINLYERGWNQPLFEDAAWRTLCDQRAAFGFTVLQAVVYNESEHWQDGEYPFGGTEGADHDVVNPVSWQRVDARVAYAVQQGLMPYLLTSSDGTHLGWPEEQRTRLYRYIVARYAAYGVAFGGGEELDRGGFGTDDKYRHMIASYHQLDPYRRLVGLHAEGVGTKLVPDDVDILLIQYYTNDVSFAESEAASRGLGKPFINAETWYFDNGQPEMDDPVTIRRMAWRILLGGAAGYTYGHMGIAIPTGSSHPEAYDIGDLTDESAVEMRTVSSWFRDPAVHYWTWSRFEELGSGRTLSACPGEQYAIFVEDDAGSLSVDLSDASGVLAGRWYDIAAAAYGGAVSVTASDGVGVTPPGPWHVLLLDAS